MLETRFQELCQTFCEDKALIMNYYEEIRRYHSHKERYYHNLSHLCSLYELLEPIDLSPLSQFSIFYHDIIYTPQQQNNEQKSAALAQKRLQVLGVPKEIIQDVYKLIIATKSHDTLELRYHPFLDADIGILGAKLEHYQNYAKAIRQEYSLYDDKSYQAGRQKVLQHFLDKPHLYLTEYFQQTYEEQARSNLAWELTTLT